MSVGRSSTHYKKRLQGYQQTIDDLTEKLNSKLLSRKDKKMIQGSQKQSTKAISTKKNESEGQKTRSSVRKRKATEVENEKGENERNGDVTAPCKNSAELPERRLRMTSSECEEDSASDNEKTPVPYFEIIKQSIKLPGWNKTTR